MGLAFGDRIKEIRELMDLSQKDMAELIDISPRFYQDLENGKKGPSFETVQKAVEKLRMTWADFMKEKPVEPKTVGEMTPEALEELVARASKRDGTLNLEIAALKKEKAILAQYLPVEILNGAKPEGWRLGFSHYFLTSNR